MKEKTMNSYEVYYRVADTINVYEDTIWVKAVDELTAVVEAKYQLQTRYTLQAVFEIKVIDVEYAV